LTCAHFVAPSDSFRKDFSPFLILLLRGRPKNEGILEAEHPLSPDT
jgi:hypothetical protein